MFSLTNSKISCFSSSCRSSCLDRLRATGAVVVSSGCSWEARNVGVPSTVVTMGLRPPRSNSCADILRTGVVVPLLPPPPPPLQPDVPTDCCRSMPVGVIVAFPPILPPPLPQPPPPPPLAPQLLAEACETSQASTIFLVAFLNTQLQNQLWSKLITYAT